MGKVVGNIKAHYFTVGQRKGLNVGGTTDPLFIVGTNVDTNTIYTGLTSQHPGLFRSALFIEKSVHWIRQDMILLLENLRSIAYEPLQTTITKSNFTSI
jgi:tRNA-specific 2-thiouridylase